MTADSEPPSPTGGIKPEALTIGVYDKAFLDVFTRVARRIQAADPVFGQIETQTSEHRGPMRNVRGEKPLDQKPFQAGVSFALTYDVIRSTDVPHLRKLLVESATKVMDEGQRAFIARMDEVLEHSGQTVKGAPTWDTYLACLEKVLVDFNPDGSPKMPQIMAGPKVLKTLLSTPPTEEQDKRFQEIMLKKQEEFRARRRARRLP